MEPVSKRARTLDTSACIICLDKLTDKQRGHVIANPSPDGLQVIFDCAEIRRDFVYDNISQFKDEILNLEMKVSYHKSCRANYTSKKSCHASSCGTDKAESSVSVISKRRLSRQDTATFSIRAHCFICAKCDVRYEKLTKISTGSGESTRQNVLHAAITRQDEVMRQRMISYNDLFAYDAKYHRSCYSKYISHRNVHAASKRLEQIQEETVYDKAMSLLQDELDKTVFSHEMKVIHLSAIRTMYINILTEQGGTEPESYTSWKLKEKLKTIYTDRISFIERAGKSDWVCSSLLSVGEAIKKVDEFQRLSATDEHVEYDDIGHFQHNYDESQVIHMAAGILRKSLSNIKENTDKYMSLTDMNIGTSSDFVPALLRNFVSWLVSNKSYQNAESFEHSLNSKTKLKALAICHDIIATCQHVRTPITLGLAIQMHHDHGSREIIDILYSLGHCVSYDEVRRFLSSLANDQLTSEDRTFIPRGLLAVDTDGASRIDAAIDNFDQNEETLDGKATTHAMATVIYQRNTVSVGVGEIPRTTDKVLKEHTLLDDNDTLQRYKKPATRPEPPTVSSDINCDTDSNLPSHREAIVKDLVHKLVRYAGVDTKVPSWTPFNSLLSVAQQPLTTIRYLPFIHESPTDMSTIYTALLRLVQVAESLGQDHIFVTADLSIYSKAVEILWNKPPEIDGKVTMRMGMMHLIMAMIASIGKLYCDGGLQSLLVDSDVFADTTTRLMLQGKELNRGVRGLKLASEALSRMMFDAADEWLASQDEILISHNMRQMIHDLEIATQERDKDKMKESVHAMTEEVLNIEKKLDTFVKQGRDQSSTFIYWSNFIDAVGIITRLIRADRDADFDLHLDAVAETIPWLRAAGRNNYAKFTPVYLTEMRKLQTENPQAVQHLEQGGFVVRRSTSSSFNCVPTDQALEQSVNRECKSRGGVIGFTLRKAALTRWLVTRHLSGEYATSFKDMCDDVAVGDKHKSEGESRRLRDEGDIEKITDILTNQWQNPFDINTVPDRLVNVATGMLASEQVEHCLISCIEKGKTESDAFLNSCLNEDTKDSSFWKSQKRTKVHSFAEMSPKLSMQAGKFQIDAEVLFRRLLAVSKQRNVDLKQVLEYELSGVPISLFNNDGTLRKTTKAELGKKLESLVNVDSEIDSEPNDRTAYIIDGMALLHAQKEQLFTTFSDLAELVCKRIVYLFRGNMCITTCVLVFDRYDNELSVKTAERTRRAGGHETATHLVSGQRKVPNYRRFLTNSQNKAALAEFVCTYIESNIQDRIPEAKCLIIAGGYKRGETVKEITSTSVIDLVHLYTTQEEADTRLILHVIDACNDHTRVVIRSDDTDVLMLLVYYRTVGDISVDTYMHAGHESKTTNKQRFIPVHQICDNIATDIGRYLPAVHSLTGSDTTSAMYRIGKRTAFNTLQKHYEELNDLSLIGNSPELTDAGLEAARQFALKLYGNKRNDDGEMCTSLCELRYVIATSTDKSSANLPPTDDAFVLHARRCNYQTYIWRHSHNPNVQTPSPIGFGWRGDSAGGVVPVMSERDPAPKEVRELTHLFCADKQCDNSQQCQCLAAGFVCIDNCKCSANCNKDVIADAGDDDELLVRVVD